MTVQLGKLTGMTPPLRAALRARAIYDSDQFLAAARTGADRTELARQTGVEAHVIARLAHRADLDRVRGIGALFADLLEAAGVATVNDLAARNPLNLHATLAQVNLQMQLARRAPSTDIVRSWVSQARRLSVALEY